MARANTIFKKAFNDTLDRLLHGQDIASVSALAAALDVSRNTARQVIQTLVAQAIVTPEGTGWRVRRQPETSDFFEDREVISTEAALQDAFMDLILRDAIQPGTSFHEAALARQLDVAPSSLREFLIKLSRFGFIHKQPQKAWVFEGFTEQYAEELHEIRHLFELRALEKLTALPVEDPFWPRLTRMLTEHRQFIEQYDTDYLSFSKLDARFHGLLNSAARNRFIESFQDIIALIFHYHYQWNKSDEKQRNLIAAHEHIDIIEALILRQPDTAKAALQQHLQTAEATLKASIIRRGKA